MKHPVLLLFVLSLAMLLFAQDKGKQMSGTICSSECVVQQNNLPTCDPTCTVKTGPAVFVSDSGTVMQIANQEMAMPHMGKKVKLMAAPTEKQREEALRIMQLTEQGP